MFIDTLQIRLLTSLVKPHQFDHLSNILKLDKEVIYKATGYASIVANYKNLKITINEKNIHVNGSLPKFYFGNNVQTFSSEQQVNDALKQLSTELGIPILKGDIVRVDVAISIPLNSNIAFYMKSLKETPGYGYAYNEGRYINKKYKKGNLVLAFYDKTLDATQYKSLLLIPIVMSSE